jgi:hypothetical protein
VDAVAERMRPVMQEPAGLSTNAAAAELNRRKIAGATGREWVSDHCDPAARAAHMIGTARIGDAKTQAFAQSRRDRKKVEMLFAHLKRILRLDRLRLRGPNGAQFEFTLAAIAQNLRRLAKLVVRPPPVMAVECPA